jgi:hypothetical protein
MNAPVVAPARRSHWTGLDVVALEEIDALTGSRRPHRRSPPPGDAWFVSDDDFLVQTMRFLAEHRDPAALVASLCAAFPPPQQPAEPVASEERQSDNDEAEAAAAHGRSGVVADAGAPDTDEDEAGGDELL